jgi:hypothetical protein
MIFPTRKNVFKQIQIPQPKGVEPKKSANLKSGVNWQGAQKKGRIKGLDVFQ